MYCSNCGQENPVEVKFCSNCGKPVSATVTSAPDEVSATAAMGAKALSQTPLSTDAVSSHMNSSDVTDEALRMFIGRNAEKYLKKWSKIDSARPMSKFGWNWPAFLFNVYWLAYRKMYLQSLMWGAAFLIVGLFFKEILIIGPIVLGVTANAQYFAIAKHKVQKIKAASGEPGTQRAAMMRQGGTSALGLIVSLVIYVGVAVAESFI